MGEEGRKGGGRERKGERRENEGRMMMEGVDGEGEGGKRGGG
jgi:hypothetical protein